MMREAARKLACSALNEGFELEAIHPYTNTASQVLYWLIRLKHPRTGEKWIRPMCYENREFLMKEPAFPNGKPLYHLHWLAPRAAETVFLVEGEKCADALDRLGIFATTSGGADSVDKADWSPLRRRTVKIWPDNDEAGARYAEAAAVKLKSLGCIVSVIDVAALDLPPNGDCVDWLNAHPNAKTCDIEQLPVRQVEFDSHRPERDSKAEAPARADLDCARPERGVEVVASNTTVAEPPARAGLDCPRPERERNVVASNDAVRPKPFLEPADEKTDVTAKLAALSPFEYAQVRRSEAKRLGVTLAVLDDVVHREKKEREKSSIVALFPTVVPASEPVDPAQMLNEIHEVIRTFIVCEPETSIAATLWIAFTWFIDHAQVAPLAVITAPEKRCGKSQMLSLIGSLSRRPLIASNISPAALYRVIASHAPTLLIDEVDTFLRENEELRGVINSGHTRQSAFVVRTGGEDHEPRRFSTWGAKALSVIGTLADTLMDRAVVLALRRKLPGENVERLRHADALRFERLASQLARFEADAGQAIARARPALPRELNDRAQDNWEPLLAIADHAGGDWPTLARDAARKISATKESTSSASVELLADVHEIFAASGSDRLASTELLRRLNGDEMKRWGTYHRGQPMTARAFAKLVGQFGVEPRNLRLGEVVIKGYLRADFEDAFERYVPSSSVSVGGATPLHDARSAANQGHFSVAAEVARSAQTGSVADESLRNRGVAAREANEDVESRASRAVADSETVGVA